MLVNASEMLKKAKAGHYAVGQFNTYNGLISSHVFSCTFGNTKDNRRIHG